MRTCIIQNICPHYRVPFFRQLAEERDITLLYGRGDRRGAARNAAQVEGIDAHRLRTWKLGLRALQPYLSLSWFPGLSRELARLRPDVIVSGGVAAFPNTLTALRHGRRHNVPVVVWDPGRRPHKPMPWFRRLLEPIQSHILAHASACIAYGRTGAAYYLSVGVAEERIFVAPNALDIDTFIEDRERRLADGDPGRRLRSELGLDDKPVLLLYVGAVEKRKRLGMLLDAAHTLSDEGLAVAVAIVGDGPELERIRADGARRPFPVTVPGRIVDDVGRFFAGADVFVLPGPGGLSINQAMAYALPVIVWGGDGTEDDLIVQRGDAANGHVVHDYAGLLQETRALVSDRTARRAMGDNALQRIRRFDLANMCRQFGRALDSVSGLG